MTGPPAVLAVGFSVVVVVGMEVVVLVVVVSPVVEYGVNIKARLIKMTALHCKIFIAHCF